MAGFLGGIPFLIIASLFTSSLLVILNKYLMAFYQFDYPIALTTFHFACTYSVLEILCRFRFFERAENFPSKICLITACESVAGILFMNISLKMNSVGFYQLSKLLCVPGLVIANLILFKQKTSPRTLISLFMLLFGVGLYTVTEINFTFAGGIVALIAVFFTVIFQVHTAYVYNLYHIDGASYQLANAGYMFFYGLIATLIEEGRYPHSVFEYIWSYPEMILAVLTGMVAVWSNVLGITLIGRCSPMTFQVVGHVKSIIIFIAGMIFVDDFEYMPRRLKIRKIVSVSVGMIGAILYTIIQSQENTELPKPEKNDDFDEINNSFKNEEDVNHSELKQQEDIAESIAFNQVPVELNEQNTA